MGQELYIYPDVPLIARMAMVKMGIYNSQLLTVQSFDTGDVTITCDESGKEYTVTHEFVESNLRSGHCFTIAASQARTIPGTIAIWDTNHKRMSRRHLFRALSRAREYELLSIED